METADPKLPFKHSSKPRNEYDKYNTITNLNLMKFQHIPQFLSILYLASEKQRSGCIMVI